MSLSFDSWEVVVNMPKKVVFSREDVVSKAFEILKEEGLNSITARNIAKKLKSSPAPIYSYFSSMNDLKEELIDIAKDQFLSYLQNSYTDMVFLNVGMGIVVFAREEKKLFGSIFLKNNSYRDIIDGFKKIVFREIESDPRFKKISHEKTMWLIEKCWIYAHGLATLVSTNFIKDTSDEYIKKSLLDLVILSEHVLGDKAYEYKKV